MATRLYPTTGSAAGSPAALSGWENTGAGFARYPATITAANYTDMTSTGVGSGVANEDTVTQQLIYGPIAATTLTGTVKGQLMAREANAAADARAQITIRIMAPDFTTSRGTALGFDTAALANEFVVAAGGTGSVNRKFPRGGAQSLTSTSVQDGDYVVIDIGFRNHGTNTGDVRVTAPSGDGHLGDLPENETTTPPADFRGWIEFSQTLSPYVPVTGGPATATGAALNASTTVAPTVTAAATATGAANDATISFLTPPRSVTINGTDYIGDALYSGFSLTECANRGEVGTGGFDVLDGISAMSIPAMKAVLFEEPAAGFSNSRIFTGFTNDRTMAALSGTAARAWGVECVDLNILASDFVLTDAEGADRPAETDYVRVAWLITTALNSVGGVAVGVVPNANTVTMEATDYRGRKPADLLAECSEAAQKLWFIYDYGAGRKLYYDLATNTSLSSTVQLSDVSGEPNGSTIFGIHTATAKQSPDRIYSKVHLTYNGGTVTVSDGAVASAYRQREAAVLDSSISDVTLATVKANALLAGAGSELTHLEGVSVVMAAAHVNDIRAGQRVEIKVTRYDIDAFTYYRVVKRTVEPIQNTTHYMVSLDLADDVLASANGARGGDEIWPQKSNANDDGATVIVDRNGINIIDGAITVVNPLGTTIIDGTSDIFKIAASGSQSVTSVAHSSNSASTTLSSLTFSATPVAILNHATTNTTAAFKEVGYHGDESVGEFFVATSSGGAVNTPVWLPGGKVLSGAISLNGSSHPVLTVYVGNPSAVNATRYQYYYVLQETTF